jgi:probable rRNA maturation factor
MGSRPKTESTAATDRDSSAARRLEIEIVGDAGPWSAIGTDAEIEHLIEAAAGALARHPDVTDGLPAAACVALSDDATAQRLNAGWRGKDKPTNVLSFPSEAATPEAVGAAPFIGDVILACETIAAEARELQIPIAHHIQHLVVHGLLHLLGYDHETDDEAALMERIETETLATLAIPDPYQSEEACDR